MSGIRYARSGEASVVYREFEGIGDRELVVVTGATMPMEAWIDDRVGRRFLEGLRRLGRVVLFDRRGIGLSDPLDSRTDMLRVAWSHDLEAVIDAAGLHAPVIVALNMTDPAVVLAARAPARVQSLILYEPNVPWCTTGSDGRLDQAVAARGLRDLEDPVDIVGLTCPSRADEPGFREWFDRAGRAGASPAVARRLYEVPHDAEAAALEDAHQSLDVPTLVLRRRRASLLSDQVVDHLFPGIAQIDLPGRDNLFIGEDVDALLAEISRFVTGEVRLPERSRYVTAIVFTDLVDSTHRARTMGDERWRAVIEVHDQTVRRIIEHRGGRVVKSMGDGVMGLLPAASSAVRCAEQIRRTLREQDLDVRIGIHIGDVDARGEDVSGLAVNIAARVMAMANAGEILVSESTVLAAAGEGQEFEPRGRFGLKGLPGDWALHAVASAGRL